MPPSHRVLLIEDDPDIADLVAADLADGGFEVEQASSGMGGLLLASQHPPDLILLDLGLPDLDGREVLSRLRQTSRVPVVVFTALDVVGEKVKLLLAGADDYLVKPVDARELLARLRTQLRRATPDATVVGDLSIHVVQRLVTYQGCEVPLSHMEFDLLALLARSPGQVYTREAIGAQLWQRVLPWDSTLIEIHVSNLRGKLRVCQAFRVVRTVRGSGYALHV